MKRRSFLSTAAIAPLAASLPASVSYARPAPEPWLKISLQQYSFRSLLMSKPPKLATLDYPAFAVQNCDVKALEYFNGFFTERAGDDKFFAELRKRCDDLQVENQLILCKNSRAIDDADAQVRSQAAKDYVPWIEAAKMLGCHSIRVDCRSKGVADEVLKQATEGLHLLCDLASPYDIDIIIENHGNHSSNGAWLAKLVETANRPNLGTLPDFGNFKEYDRYKGVQETLPWARAVCAKIHEFSDDGKAAHTDFVRMLKIIKEGGFTGYIGIEYEGKNPTPLQGVLMAKKLIEESLREIG